MIVYKIIEMLHYVYKVRDSAQNNKDKVGIFDVYLNDKSRRKSFDTYDMVRRTRKPIPLHLKEGSSKIRQEIRAYFASLNQPPPLLTRRGLKASTLGSGRAPL